VVRIDIADGAFEPDTTKIRMQWTQRIDQLLEELRKGPSVLRLSYLGDVEPKALALERLAALKKEITARWKQSGAGYQRPLRPKSFWRRGAPIAGHDNGLMKTMLRHLRTVKGFFPRHGIAVLCVCGVTVAGTGVASSEVTGVRETHVGGEAAEMHLPTDQPLTPWVHDPAIFEKDEGDRTELREVVEKEVTTIKLERWSAHPFRPGRY